MIIKYKYFKKINRNKNNFLIKIFLILESKNMVQFLYFHKEAVEKQI